MSALIFMYLVAGTHLLTHTVYFLLLYALPMYLVVKGLIKLYKFIEKKVG